MSGDTEGNEELGRRTRTRTYERFFLEEKKKDEELMQYGKTWVW